MLRECLRDATAAASAGVNRDIGPARAIHTYELAVPRQDVAVRRAATGARHPPARIAALGKFFRRQPPIPAVQ
jgi:hypothetical protein